jgi:hypothetical protein
MSGLRIADWNLLRASSIIVSVISLAIAMSVGSDDAPAQELAAQYAISMTGIPVGTSAWSVALNGDAYHTSASGSAAGILAILMTARGTVETSGKIRGGRLVPSSYRSDVVELGEKFELTMKLNEGVATDLEIDGPRPGPNRVPIADGDRRGIIDPLSALLIPNLSVGGRLAPDTCNRTLPIFDGRRRFDLVMSFRRVDDLADRAYEGAVLVCNLLVRPIAGHRANSPITKYVVARQDMELTFASMRGTRFLAPFRLSVPTLVGTMVVQATQFLSSSPVAVPR